MAHIIKTSNTLSEEYKRIRRKGRKSIAIGAMLSILLFAALFAFTDTYELLALTILIPVPVFVGRMIAMMCRREATIVEKGIEGEKRCASVVARLPKGYYGLQHVHVTYEGKSSEVDMIAVGPTGVFVIEVKNLTGTICGDYESYRWVQEKTGRGGGTYSKEFYSPIKQVGTHVYRVANFLKQNKIWAHVDGMVYFSNPDAKIHLRGNEGRIPVFSSYANKAIDIYRHVTERESVLSEKEIWRICSVLKRAR